MSCRPWEESAPDSDPETPNPVTPTKLPRNAWAGQDNPDAENSECQYDSDEPFRKIKKTRVEIKKRERHLIVYVPIKRWQTGERAEMEEDEMMFDVAEEARKEMLLSGFKIPILPKPTDLGLWKKGQVHESRCITYTFYKCPMSGRAGCRCMLRLVMAKDYLELQRSELRHHAASHAQDNPDAENSECQFRNTRVTRDAIEFSVSLLF